MTRKMQIFYSTMIFLVLTGIFSIFSKVVFSSDNLTNIILMTMAFSAAMAGANFGEHWAKMKVEQSKNDKE